MSIETLIPIVLRSLLGKIRQIRLDDREPELFDFIICNNFYITSPVIPN